MKNIKQVTIIFVVSALVLILGYDVFAIFMGGTDASISNLIITFSYKMPIAVFAAGVVCGHLFWRMKSNKSTKEIDKETHE